MQVMSQKGQLIRLADVFFIGPFLIYVGFKQGISKSDKYLLIGIGVATIAYNAYNFIEIYNKDRKDGND